MSIVLLLSVAVTIYHPLKGGMTPAWLCRDGRQCSTCSYSSYILYYKYTPK